MDYNMFLKFLVNNFMFSFIIIILSFSLGWLLYDRIVTRKISLHDALFEKDNFAAWVEFIGAFIFPSLYLAAMAVEGSASDNIWFDLGTCIIYAAAYIILFTVLRLLSGSVIRLINTSDNEGIISLNNEIYNQKNIAASLFSVAVSTISVTIVRFLDVLPGYFVTSVFKMLEVLIFILLSFAVYSLVLRRRTTLFKEIFIDNNTAAGVCFLGFIFAIGTIISGVVINYSQGELDFLALSATTLICLVLFGVLSFLFKYIFLGIIKVDFWNEIYEQNNIGAAIGQSALYIGIANVIVHFMR